MLGISNKIIVFVISNTKLSISNWLSFSVLLPDHITQTKCCHKVLNTLLILIVLMAPLTAGASVPRMLRGQFQGVLRTVQPKGEGHVQDTTH